MRDIACSDCVVTMLLGPMPSSLDPHKEALDVLADAGLIAPLRLVTDESAAPTKAESNRSTNKGKSDDFQQLASNL